MLLDGLKQWKLKINAENNGGEKEVKIGNQKIEQVKQFCYLESKIRINNKCTLEVITRAKEAFMKEEFVNK